MSPSPTPGSFQETLLAAQQRGYRYIDMFGRCFRIGNVLDHFEGFQNADFYLEDGTIYGLPVDPDDLDDPDSILVFECRRKMPPGGCWTMLSGQEHQWVWWG